MYNPTLYSKPYHTSVDLSKHQFLVTGGAGFIGSNLVEYLLKYGAKKVRVIDNLSTGYLENIADFTETGRLEFIEGDIRDFYTCSQVVDSMDYIFHLAALGSIPRSISNPLTTNEVNISGFLNMITAAKDSKTLRRFVYAASSSSYGDSKALPKVEGNEGKPLSPYALTKFVNELYGDVFSKVYGFHTIGLRYFNVFGPKQNPNNPYAAVIPIFCKAVLHQKPITIFGDGETSRDFTFVENAVQANIKAIELESLEKHEVFNTACGEQTSLNELVGELKQLIGTEIQTNYSPERKGDIKHSRASIEKIESILKYKPSVDFNTGLEIVFKWYKSQAY